MRSKLRGIQPVEIERLEDGRRSYDDKILRGLGGLERGTTPNSAGLSDNAGCRVLKGFWSSGPDSTSRCLSYVDIAERFERGGNQEFMQFLYVARGSCGEVRSQLYVALDQGYIGQGAFDGIMKSSRRLSVMISNFVAYLKNSSMKGQKFKKP